MNTIYDRDVLFTTERAFPGQNAQITLLLRDTQKGREQVTKAWDCYDFFGKGCNAIHKGNSLQR